MYFKQAIDQLPEGFDKPLEMVKECIECNHGKDTNYRITSIKSWGEGWETQFEFSVVVDTESSKEYECITTFENGWEKHQLKVA